MTTSSPSESAITGEIRELSRGRKRRPISEREEEGSNQHKTPVGVSSSRPRRLVLDSSDLKVYDLMSTDS